MKCKNRKLAYVLFVLAEGLTSLYSSWELLQSYVNLLLRNNLFVAIHFHLGSPLVPIVILGPIIVFKTGNAISSAVVSSRYFFRCRSVLLQFK